MKKILLVLLVSGILFSCWKKKDDDNITINDNDYLVFGHFYGECMGEECVETFKLTSSKLYEDILDDYSGQNLEFVELTNELFLQVNDLETFFPEQLLDETESVIGCPDCADGGGLYVLYSDNGNLRSWRIDKFQENVPTYLHSFMNKINEKIALINQ